MSKRLPNKHNSCGELEVADTCDGTLDTHALIRRHRGVSVEP